MIEPTSFRKLSLGDKQNFADEVVPKLKTSIGEKPTFKPYVAEVEAGLATLKGTAQTLSHPEFTEEINEGDGMRDGGLGSLKINAIRSKDRKDPVWIQAGQRVLRAFNDFGNDMATRSIAKETSAVDNFLNAIDSTPELKSAIATIQGNIFVQDIRDGQQLVKQGIAKRDASNKTEELAAY